MLPLPAIAVVGWLAGCSDPSPIAPAYAPRIGSGGAIHLVVLGDTGSDTAERLRVQDAVAHHCADRRCDAVVIAGDLLYPRGAESVSDPRLDALVAPYAAIAPLYLAVGNHDYGHGRDHEAVADLLAWAQQQPQIHLPSTVYTAPLGGLGHLVVLDTNHLFQFGDRPLAPLPSSESPLDGQGAFLELVGRDPEDLVVVLGHHPFRSNGPHGNAGAYEGWRHLPWASGRSLEHFFQTHLVPRAGIYLAGHDHNLQVLPCEGLHCVVSGGGAKKRELVDRGNEPYVQASSVGFVALQLSAGSAIATVHDSSGAQLGQATLPLGR